MKLRKMLQGLELDTRSMTIKEDQIPEVEKWLGMKIGPQLKEYILEYSYLCSDEMGDEFLSIVDELGEKNDMVVCTRSLREIYRGTENFVMIESHVFEDVHVLVDANDNVFYIDESDDSIVDAEMKLFDHMYLRLKYGDWVFMDDESRAEVEMSPKDRRRYANA